MSARRPEGFDPGAIIEAFNRNGVRYVVIGAFAAQLQGAPIPRTRDIDLTPSSDPVNLERLSAALDELGARIRIADDLDGLPFDHDATSLGRVQMWNLTSPHGDFDIAFTPSGTDGYEDLARRARVIDDHGTAIPVADLEDVIRSKEAARRPKDIVHLPILIQTARRRTAGRRLGRIEGPDLGS